jgi:hypothetical protein
MGSRIYVTDLAIDRDTLDRRSKSIAIVGSNVGKLACVLAEAIRPDSD